MKPVKVEVQLRYQKIAEIFSGFILEMSALALLVADMLGLADAPLWFVVPVYLTCVCALFVDVFAWFHKRRITKQIMNDPRYHKPTGHHPVSLIH